MYSGSNSVWRKGNISSCFGYLLNLLDQWMLGDDVEAPVGSEDGIGSKPDESVRV